MGATSFAVTVVARTPGDAYDKAVKDALHWHGHGGYTGTIAEKDGYKLAGKVNTFHVDKLEEYFQVFQYERRKGQIAKSIRPVIEKFAPIYDDKWGPAVCFEITGTRAIELKKATGRANTMDKAWIFLGMASE